MITTCLTHFLEGVREHPPVFAPIMLLSLVFPIIAAPFARAAYHRLVTRFMGFRQVRSPPPAWWVLREQRSSRSALAGNVVEAATPDALASTMRYRLQRIRRATLVAYITFVVGTGLSVPLHWGAAAEFALAAAALGIGPALVNATPRTLPRSVTVLVIALLTFSMTFDRLALLPFSMTFDRFTDLASIVVAFGLVFAFYLIGTNRTLRALYVPLFFIGFGALAGGVAAAILTQGLQRCFALFVSNTNAIEQIINSVLLIGFIPLGIWIANRLIASLARLYERGWISDISLVFLFGMALTAALAGPTARVSLLRPWSPRIRFGSR